MRILSIGANYKSSSKQYNAAFSGRGKIENDVEYHANVNDYIKQETNRNSDFMGFVGQNNLGQLFNKYVDSFKKSLISRGVTDEDGNIIAKGEKVVKITDGSDEIPDNINCNGKIIMDGGEVEQLFAKNIEIKGNSKVNNLVRANKVDLSENAEVQNVETKKANISGHSKVESLNSNMAIVSGHAKINKMVVEDLTSIDSASIKDADVRKIAFVNDDAVVDTMSLTGQSSFLEIAGRSKIKTLYRDGDSVVVCNCSDGEPTIDEDNRHSD